MNSEKAHEHSESGFKRMRLKLGFNTQAGLARRLNVSVAAVSAWEKGTRHPAFTVCADLLGMGAAVEDLFGVTYSPTDLTKNGENDYPNAGDLRDALRVMDERLQRVEREIEKEKAE